MKVLIRKIAPIYKLDENTQKIFLSSLHSLYSNLQPIFSKYIQNKQISKLAISRDDKKLDLLKKINKDDVVLISANSSKKKLKNIGIDPSNFIITGGPLNIEDYKIINPNISEKALQGIIKKCKRLKDQILGEDWKTKQLFFVYEKDNITDKLILNSLETMSGQIQKTPVLIELTSWSELDG